MVLAAAFAALAEAPVQATQSVALPDPSGLTLFSLGIAGLLIGRHIARKRHD